MRVLSTILLISLPVLLASCSAVSSGTSPTTDTATSTSAEKQTPKTDSAQGPRFIDALEVADDKTKHSQQTIQTVREASPVAVGSPVIVGWAVSNNGTATKGLHVALSGPVMQQGILSAPNSLTLSTGVSQNGSIAWTPQSPVSPGMSAAGVYDASFANVDIPAKTLVRVRYSTSARTAGSGQWTLTFTPQSGGGAFQHTEKINVVTSLPTFRRAQQPQRSFPAGDDW